MIITESDIRSALQNTASRKKQHKPEQTRAAVLIPIITAKKELEILLTQRTDQVEHHKNQISFPGGVVDAVDNSVVDAALRETEEELGIPAGEIEIIGQIDEVTTPSRFLITPIVGLLRELPPLHLNRTEVQEAFTIPLSYFAGENNYRIEYREFEGKQREVYFYEYGGKTVWGVTAYMIRLFLECVGGEKKM